MLNSICVRVARGPVRDKRRSFKRLKIPVLGLLVAGFGSIVSPLLASDSVITGSVRVQMLSDSLVRLEAKGIKGFEDRHTFHVANRDWPGTPYTTNVAGAEIVISTRNYVVHVLKGATSLSDTYVTSPKGKVLYRFDGTLNNSVWLPGPSAHPGVLAFADAPRLIPPTTGLTPGGPTGPFPQTSGWDINNDAPDIYVFVPSGSYQQLRKDFLRLTGPTEMVPLYALGSWDSRWYDYNEAAALAQVDEYRARHIPLDVLVCDTGWRQGASTGYQPNTNLFPDLPRFFSEAHAKDVRLMFNDHPEPVAATALDPREVSYRYGNLARLLGQGLDVWWYDRNWGISLLSPSPKLRHEVWGMAIYHDATHATNVSLRPMIMANVDGIDNGIRNRPPDVAAHRYSIQWTGDIQPSMAYLQHAVENAVHSGVEALFPYESDDLGGHVSDPSPNDYIRWIEYGALSPIYRPHCTHFLSRMPWTFGAEAEWVARRFISMRYRLLPVLYAAARANFDEGEPILRRLDLDYPQYPEAARENEYLIGHSLLVAPAMDGPQPVPSAWLTAATGEPGLNATYFSNENLAGSPALTRVDSNIDFDWGTGSPDASVPNDHFTARWTGNITVPSSAGDVILAATSDDGVRAWLDGKLCIDNWGPNDAVTTESKFTLKAGQKYSLRIEYLELTANAILKLKWRAASSSDSVSVWIPPGNWINAWTGALVKGPANIVDAAALDRIPLYIRSGSIFALAPQMEFTGQLPWDPITLDTYPNPGETAETSLYEDDTLTTAYKRGQFRNTAIKMWTDDADKTVSISIGAASGIYSNAPTQRSWTMRIHRPPSWPSDLAPSSVTLNGAPLAGLVRHVANLSSMPLGADNGAPDADFFEITTPELSVVRSNVLVAHFSSSNDHWLCADIGDVGARGNALGGASNFSNSVCIVRGGGSGIDGTNDGFHFLYQSCADQARITVHLLNQSTPNASAKAGIMFRETLASSARNVALTMNPAGQLVLQSRSSIGHSSKTHGAVPATLPCWLRLVRKGNAFVSYHSTDGITWAPIGSVSIPGFRSRAYAGIVSTVSDTNTWTVDDTNCNIAAFGNLTLGGSASDSAGISTQSR